MQIKALTEELRVARLERDGLGLQLERSEAGRRAVEADGREREEALGAAVRAKGDEAAKALTALRYEKKEKVGAAGSGMRPGAGQGGA